MDRLSNNPDYELLEEDIGTEDEAVYVASQWRRSGAGSFAGILGRCKRTFCSHLYVSHLLRVHFAI